MPPNRLPDAWGSRPAVAIDDREAHRLARELVERLTHLMHDHHGDADCAELAAGVDVVAHVGRGRAERRAYAVMVRVERLGTSG